MNTVSTSSEQLIARGQPLVYSLASKIYRHIPVRVDLNDLIAYGEVGLAEAARDFNPEQGNRFTTYAYYRIRGAIYDGLSKMSWTSRARYKKLRYEQMANEALSQETGSQGIDSAADTGTLEGDARWLRNVTEKLAVVYLVTQGEERGGIRDSTLVDPRGSAATIVAHREISQRLRELVDALPAVEQRLIRTIYFEGATLQEAATRVGLSKSWASRLHGRILEKLARLLRKMGASD
jgi:RNA polymerase sigma factor for flagellar operon FliA